MKQTYPLSILVFAMAVLGYSQSNRTELLQELVQKQQQEHSAIGWVDAGRLEFIVFSEKPTMHSYTLPGPALWGATLTGSSGQIVGVIRSDGRRALAAVQDGSILWENPDLIVQRAPEVSPSGKLLVLEGRYSKTGTGSLLLVEERGQKVTQVSRDGKNPSWSPDETRFVYEQKGEIFLYDLQSKQAATIGLGTAPSWSPDGKWISYRNAKNQFVLADTDGKVQRTLLDGKRVLTPLHWSPDSEYLMYVGKNKLGGCKELVVYRIRDGQRGSVYPICEGYPFWMLRWLRIPLKVSLE